MIGVSKNSGHVTKHTSKYVSPIRVPSIFCRQIAHEVASDTASGRQSQYVMKTSRSRKQLSTTIASCASAEPAVSSKSTPIASSISGLFSRKLLNRNRSVKRLNNTVSTSNGGRSPGKVNMTKSIDDDDGDCEDEDDADEACTSNNSQAQLNSPTSRQLIMSTNLRCTDESIDL